MKKTKINYRLSVKYREKVEEFLYEFIENCSKCNGTGKMAKSAEKILFELEKYSEKH